MGLATVGVTKEAIADVFCLPLFCRTWRGGTKCNGGHSKWLALATEFPFSLNDLHAQGHSALPFEEID